MASVFKKLIRKEFGENSYNTYFNYYHKNINSTSIDNKEVFEDIYLKLKEYDTNTILLMNKRLNDTLLAAFRISKSYIMIPFVYMLSVIFLLVRNIHPVIVVPALLLITACFIIKSYEFIVNKYCYIDARIVLVYKSVLDSVMFGKKDFSA